MGIQSLHIENFKSVRNSGTIEFAPINVFIGANGAGKSNFLSFFKLLNKIYDSSLELYIAQNGRVDNFLHFGRKTSSYLSAKLIFDNDYHNEYAFTLVPDQEGNFVFSREWSNTKDGDISIDSIGKKESGLKNNTWFRTSFLRENISSLRIFHFHDTSANAKVKQASTTQDYAFLQEDGGNLAAFLYRLQESHYENFVLIEKVIKSIAPFFDAFFLMPDEINPQQIYLRWKEKGHDQLFTAHNLSDGTIRMICLATLLLQPNPPKTIIIDEPELGLHPFAISKLAGLLQTVPEGTQIIIATQSVALVSEFSPDDIIVVEREKNQETSFTRQSSESLSNWLKDYSLGELWQKNVIGGRPR